MTDSVAGAIDRPMPNANVNIDAATIAYPSAASANVMRPRPAATAVMPSATVARVPRRLAIAADSGAPRIMPPATGSSRTPDSSAS
jgi:hypothetical protein